MLQQTQVATVIPYYERFLESFPTVRELAAADEDRVLFHWSGLGYYRRARQIHAAAKVIVEKHGGEFPEEFDQVLSLPGIGRYTAGAICSFALDQRTPIVEANTQRLYARLLRLRGQLTASVSQTALWSFAEAILPPRAGSGAVNQAVMELGSQICTPRDPLCSECPLISLCPTYANQEQDEIPSPKPAKVYEEKSEIALLVRDPNRGYLMRRCGAGERWEGLWDFPRFEVPTDSQVNERIQSATDQFQTRYGSKVSIGDASMSLKHGVTKYRITLNCHEAEVQEDPSDQENLLAWYTETNLSELPLSSTGKTIFKKLIECKV